MKALDHLFQRWRINKVRRYIPRGARVLDVGCWDGALFRQIQEISFYVGIDPHLQCAPGTNDEGNALLIEGRFPEDLPQTEPFDSITVLAVLEHVPEPLQGKFARDCFNQVKRGGRVLLTVPHPRSDIIFELLLKLRLIDGMALDQHHDFDVLKTTGIFRSAGFEMVCHRRFQLGLNNLFVFQKPA